MRFLASDLTRMREAELDESKRVYHKYGAVVNVCLPLSYDIYNQSD